MVPWKVKVDARGNRLKIGLKAIFPWARRLFHVSLGLKLTQLSDKKTSFSHSHRFVKKSKALLRGILHKCGMSAKKKRRNCFPECGRMFGGFWGLIPAKVWRVVGFVSVLAVLNCSILHFLFSLF